MKNDFEKELKKLIGKVIVDLVEGKFEEMNDHFAELSYLKELYDESKEEDNNGNI